MKEESHKRMERKILSGFKSLNDRRFTTSSVGRCWCYRNSASESGRFQRQPQAKPDERKGAIMWGIQCSSQSSVGGGLQAKHIVIVNLARVSKTSDFSDLTVKMANRAETLDENIFTIADLKREGSAKMIKAHRGKL